MARWMAGAAALVMAGSAGADAGPGRGLAGLRVGGFAGYESADVSGLALRADAELSIRALGPTLALSGVGSLGWSRLGERVRYGDLTSNVVKLVPAARLTASVAPAFALFADVGLGLALVSARTETTVPFFGTTRTSATSVNAMMRLGVGGWYRLTPRLDLGAMLEVDPILGDYAYSGARSQTTFVALGGAMYRL